MQLWFYCFKAIFLRKSRHTKQYKNIEKPSAPFLHKKTLTRLINVYLECALFIKQRMRPSLYYQGRAIWITHSEMTGFQFLSPGLVRHSLPDYDKITCFLNNFSNSFYIFCKWSFKKYSRYRSAASFGLTTSYVKLPRTYFVLVITL